MPKKLKYQSSEQKWKLGRCQWQTTELHGANIQEGMWGSWVQAGGGGDWACILLGLTSHCLLWSQQNGPLGPHLRHQAAGINSAADWAPLSQLLVSGREERGRCSLHRHLWSLREGGCHFLNTWTQYRLIITYHRNEYVGFFLKYFFILLYLEMTWNSHSMPIASNRYSILKTDGEEQRQRKMSVSQDVNYWLTFVWTLLGMRISEMSNRCLGYRAPLR